MPPLFRAVWQRTAQPSAGQDPTARPGRHPQAPGRVPSYGRNEQVI